MYADSGLGQGDRVVSAVAAEDDDRLLGFLALGIGVVRRGRAFEKALDVRLLVCKCAARPDVCFRNVQLGCDGVYGAIVIARDDMDRYTAVEQGLDRRGGVGSDRVFEAEDRGHGIADRKAKSCISL